MATIRKFEELECWQEARKLVKLVYGLVSKASFIRAFRLVDQITGAAISVMNNIAEGFDSQTNLEFIRFLKIARRSASEVQSLSYVVSDVGFVEDGDKKVLYEQCERCRKIIDGMLNYLRGVK